MVVNGRKHFLINFQKPKSQKKRRNVPTENIPVLRKKKEMYEMRIILLIHRFLDGHTNRK